MENNDKQLVLLFSATNQETSLSSSYITGYVCSQCSFGLPLSRMNGMHRNQTDHVHLDFLLRETYVKAQRWSKNILTFYSSRLHFLTFANTCNNIVTKARGFLSKS